MAFGAADFDIRLAGIAGDIPVWTYVYKENRREGFYDYAVALKPVSFFSELIGPYPYEKLANVQSKTIFGGLENASCIFYSENSVTGKGKAEKLIAHEVAHQWFGNSVTERRLASYMAQRRFCNISDISIFRKELRNGTDWPLK